MASSIGQEFLEAVKSENLTRVKFFLQTYPDIHTTEEGGFTSLFYAAATNNPQIIEWLIKYNVDLDTRSAKRKSTPLMYAALHNAATAMQTLYEFGARVEDVDYKGRTALFYACEGNNAVEAVVWLLARETDVNHVGVHGYTALMHAVKSSSLSVMKLLLLSGAGE